MTDKSKKECTQKICKLYESAKEWIDEEESYDVVAKRKMADFCKNLNFSEFFELVESSVALLEGQQYTKVLEYSKKYLQLLKTLIIKRTLLLSQTIYWELH